MRSSGLWGRFPLLSIPLAKVLGQSRAPHPWLMALLPSQSWTPSAPLPNQCVWGGQIPDLPWVGAKGSPGGGSAGGAPSLPPLTTRGETAKLWVPLLLRSRLRQGMTDIPARLWQALCSHPSVIHKQNRSCQARASSSVFAVVHRRQNPARSLLAWPSWCLDASL